MKQTVFVLLALCAALAWADEDREFSYGFLSGRYELIGKRIDSDATYRGRVELKGKGDHLQMTRRIDGVQVRGTGRLETTREGGTVLRIRFRDRGKAYEETCLWMSDLDNHARISCYLYEPASFTRDPGLEALFIEHTAQQGADP